MLQKTLPLSISILLMLLIGGFAACNTSGPTRYFSEQQFSFSDFKRGNYPSNPAMKAWSRKSENIRMLHETFKAVGYQKLLDSSEWSHPWFNTLGIYKTPRYLFDTLLSTYPDYKKAPEYYRQFWERRIKENNHQTVYLVLQEIHAIMTNEMESPLADPHLVNDTLFQLVAFEYATPKVSNEAAHEHLAYLIDIGLHQSAYNIFRGWHPRYEEVDWRLKEEDLLEELREVEEVSYSDWAWFEREGY